MNNTDKEEGKLILGIDPGTNFMGYAIIRTFRKNMKAELVMSGVLDMFKLHDQHQKLNRILKRILQVIDTYKPEEMAIESQFFGVNVQSMLKLGRAQGVAIAAALQYDLPVFEYAPRKIKISVTGSGSASKEQVSSMLNKLMVINTNTTLSDETDAIAIAYCHFIQSSSPLASSSNNYKNWSDFIKKNPDKLSKH